MRAHRVLALMLATCVGTALDAQSASCQSQVVTVRDVCQKGLDIFNVFATQLNGALAAGGPVIGTARTVDGISLTLRVNGMNARVPDLSSLPFAITGAQASTIASTQSPMLIPSLDAAFSVTPGMRAGSLRVLSADLLGSVVYLRRADIGAVNTGPSTGTFASSAFRTGYGARIGLVLESRRVPAVSVSFLRRSLPRTNLVTTAPVSLQGSTQRDTLSFTQSSISADAYRLALSKRIGPIEIGGGVGEDRYRNFTQLQGMVTRSIFGAPLPPDRLTVGLTRSIRRRSAYGSAAANFGHYHVGAEAGALFGGDEFPTFNTIDGYARAASRPYASLGLRYSF